MTSATPEGDRGLDGTVEAHDRGADAVVGEVLLDQARVARRHPLALDVGDASRVARAGGIPEGRPPEPERHHLDRALELESSSRSRPVIPASTVPEPT